MAEATFRRGRSGNAFDPESGKLYMFTESRVTVMTAWPEPRAWYKNSRRPAWRGCRPRIGIPGGDVRSRIERLLMPQDDRGQLLLPLLDRHEFRPASDSQLALLRWSLQIPDPVRLAIGEFPGRHWQLLAFLARCGPAAMDLARSNPALAFALANNWVFHKPAVKRPLRSARTLLERGRKQREVLAWLGFPETQAARKTLAKVVPRAVTIECLFYLRGALADPTMSKALGHLPRINRGAVRIVTDPQLAPHVCPTLLAAIGGDRGQDYRPRIAWQLRDCLRMLALLRGDDATPPPLQTVEEVENWHEELVAELNDNPDAALLTAELPPPPVPGSETIVPITSGRELIAEGDEQHNCVAAYWPYIVRHRDTYVYRVLWPERCTLALVRRGAKWMLGELRRACNEDPGEATRQHVHNWFSDNGLQPIA